MPEVELKLLVTAPVDVARLAAEVAPVVEPRPAKTLTATYYDTPDLRLARWGVTLRYRTGEGDSGVWTLKLPHDDPATRSEIEFAGGPRSIPREALAMTRAYVRSEELKPAAKLRTRRRVWALRDGEEELAEVVDDEVTVMDGRTIAGRFREVEIEARSATRKQLKAVAAALQDGGAMIADQVPKAIRALGPRAQDPPDVPAPRDVEPDDPATAAIGAALAEATRRIIEAHARVVLGDAEGVHRMRVGARRLRSDLRTFGPLVDAEWAQWISPELRWLGGVLGEVRDLDVLIARLQTRACNAGDLAPMFEQLEARRDAHRRELMAALDSGRYVALLVDLVARAADPPVTEEAARRCKDVLPSLVHAAWEPLAKAGRLLDDSDPDEEWHRVRIKAKRARYAAEAAARCLGPVSKEAAQFASCCEAVQEVLGEHQDAVVARDVVATIAKEIDALPPFHFAAGRLAEREECAAVAARDRFPVVWENLDRKKRRKWLTP